MTHSSIYQGVEFICEATEKRHLHAWYDQLSPSEVKASIIKVKCREYRPYDQASFRLTVLCAQPFSEPVRINQSREDSDNGENERIDALINSFTKWIDHHDMPEEVLVGGHCAFVDWWPAEILPNLSDALSPQDRGQSEINNQFLENLELVRLAAISDEAFSELWIGSNEPFFAAGRLLYGDFHWIRRVPSDYCRSESNTRVLLERVNEYSREYIGIMRMALLTDAESPVLDRVGFIIRRFSNRHASEIQSWLDLAQDLLDGRDDLPFSDVITTSISYEELDSVSDRFRLELVEATRGLESELVILLNAILPTLDLPPSSVLFMDKTEHWDEEQ